MSSSGLLREVEPRGNIFFCDMNAASYSSTKLELSPDIVLNGFDILEPFLVCHS